MHSSWRSPSVEISTRSSSQASRVSLTEMWCRSSQTLASNYLETEGACFVHSQTQLHRQSPCRACPASPDLSGGENAENISAGKTISPTMINSCPVLLEGGWLPSMARSACTMVLCLQPLSLTAVIQHQSSLSFSFENVKCAPTEVILSPPESSEMKLQTWQQREEVISLRAGPGLSTSVSLSARLWTFLFCSN